MKILVVDDEVNMRKILKAMLLKDKHDVLLAAHGEEALKILKEQSVQLVISDIRMPRMDGLSLLDVIQKEFPTVLVILMTAHATVDAAVSALKHGAFDFILKPFDQDEMKIAVQKAVKTLELSPQSYFSPLALPQETHAQARVFGQYTLIGRSANMLDIYQMIDKVADTPSTVLITGESGTGKELIATALHETSSRKQFPFIKINCAAIPKNLMESELFGYEKGAFTGAVSSKPGRFELADGGTLFLDEIGEIPVDMQVKLLRALQESEFERVGGLKTIRVNVRIVAATNRDLKKEIEQGHFREDLFFRLNVVPIVLPPLRERMDDIDRLTQYFVVKYNQKLKKNVQGLTTDALDALKAHPWPGNIRELENVIERTLLFTEGAKIERKDLPAELRGEVKMVHPLSLPLVSVAPESSIKINQSQERPIKDLSMKDIVKQKTNEIERQLIVQALEETAGNVTHAAKVLKISRKGLQLKMKELGLRDADEDFVDAE